MLPFRVQQLLCDCNGKCILNCDTERNLRNNTPITCNKNPWCQGFSFFFFPFFLCLRTCEVSTLQIPRAMRTLNVLPFLLSYSYHHHHHHNSGAFLELHSDPASLWDWEAWFSSSCSGVCSPPSGHIWKMTLYAFSLSFFSFLFLICQGPFWTARRCYHTLDWCE